MIVKGFLILSLQLYSLSSGSGDSEDQNDLIRPNSGGCEAEDGSKLSNIGFEVQYVPKKSFVQKIKSFASRFKGPKESDSCTLESNPVLKLDENSLKVEGTSNSKETKAPTNCLINIAGNLGSRSRQGKLMERKFDGKPFEKKPNTILFKLYREAEVVGGKITSIYDEARSGKGISWARERLEPLCDALGDLNHEAKTIDPYSAPINHIACERIKRISGEDTGEVPITSSTIAMQCATLDSPAKCRNVQEKKRKKCHRSSRLVVSDPLKSSPADQSEIQRDLDRLGESSEITKCERIKEQASEAKLERKVAKLESIGKKYLGKDLAKKIDENADERLLNVSEKSNQNAENSDGKIMGNEAELERVKSGLEIPVKLSKCPRIKKKVKLNVVGAKRIKKKELKTGENIDCSLNDRRQKLRQRITEEHMDEAERNKLINQMLFIDRMLKYNRASGQSKALNKWEKELRGMREHEVDLKHILNSEVATKQMRKIVENELACLRRKMKPVLMRSLLERQRAEIQCALINPEITPTMKSALKAQLRDVEKKIKKLIARKKMTPLDGERKKLMKRIEEVKKMLESQVVSRSMQRCLKKRLIDMHRDMKCIDRQIKLHRTIAEIKDLISKDSTSSLAAEGLRTRLQQMEEELRKLNGATVACKMARLERVIRKRRCELKHMLDDNSMNLCVRKAFLLELRHSRMQLSLLSHIRLLRTQMKGLKELLDFQNNPPNVSCSLEKQIMKLKRRYMKMLQILRKSLVHRRNIECCNSGFRHKCAVSGYKGAQKIMTCKTGLKPKSFEKFSSEFSPESMNPVNKIDHTMPFPGLDT